MERLFKDGVRLVHIELGLEFIHVMRETAAVGAASSIGEGETLVRNFFSESAPVALAAAVLLDLLGIDVGVTILGEEAWEMHDRHGSTFGNALVITVVGLVRSRHLGSQ